MRVTSVISETSNIVAITPSMIPKYKALGIEVVLSEDYGRTFPIDRYVSAGTKIEENAEADICVAIRPNFSKLRIKSGNVLIASIQRETCDDELNRLKTRGVICCILEKIPRITRAQSMDVLSSQANIAGYRAVIEALTYYKKVVPLMMTAAGTIFPAKVLVVGAGVAGLQAIATAKRLGAVVSAFDVRSVTKEQVESLGASFVEVENDDNGETSDGYAKEMSEAYKKRQADKLFEATSHSDIIITTAQIPGKPAPKLITKKMIDSMPVGSVIVDMAASSGGNCELTQNDKVITYKNTTIIGSSNITQKIAFDASELIAYNIYNFVKLIVQNNRIDISDEIVQATLF